MWYTGMDYKNKSLITLVHISLTVKPENLAANTVSVFGIDSMLAAIKFSFGLVTQQTIMNTLAPIIIANVCFPPN